MVASIAILKQIMIFVFYSLLAFGITGLINILFKSKRILSFIVPCLVLVVAIVLLVLGLASSYLQAQGFIKYSILFFCAFAGSIIASLVFCFSPKK